MQHNIIRVVQTQAILFLKSMSEKVRSVIERLWNWSISRSTQNRLKMMSYKFRLVTCWIHLCPTFISKIKWLGSGVPLLKWSFLNLTWSIRHDYLQVQKNVLRPWELFVFRFWAKNSDKGRYPLTRNWNLILESGLPVQLNLHLSFLHF